MVQRVGPVYCGGATAVICCLVVLEICNNVVVIETFAASHSPPYLKWKSNASAGADWVVETLKSTFQLIPS